MISDYMENGTVKSVVLPWQKLVSAVKGKHMSGNAKII